MSQPLYRIRELIKELPGKDAAICQKYLEERNFQCIMEIVESDIYKARQKADSLEMVEEDSEINSFLAKLLELKTNLDEYMSYLEVPDNSDDLYRTVYEIII